MTTPDISKINLSKINFTKMNKRASQSFFKHKNLIKKLGNGETVLCEHCKQPLKLTVSSESQQGINCSKGCTNIEFEVE